MKKQIILLSLIIALTVIAQAKVYENDAIPIKEIGDSFSFSYQNTAVTFTYEGNDQFRIMQIKTGYDRDDVPQQPEVLLDQKIILSKEFKEINLQEFSVLAKIKKSADKIDLTITRDIANYVDLSVENIKFSKDELTFKVCNKGNEASISEQRLDVMVMPNFVEGGSENIIVGKKFEKRNILPNDCEEVVMDTDELRIAPEKINKITIFLPYNDFVWSNTPIDIDQSNNKINVNVEKKEEKTNENQNTEVNPTNTNTNSQTNTNENAEEKIKEITIEMSKPLSPLQKVTKFFKKLFK